MTAVACFPHVRGAMVAGIVTVLAMWLQAALGAAPAAGAAGDSPEPAASAAPTSSPPPACARPLQELVDAAAPGGTVRLPACTSTETLQVRQPLKIDARGTLIDGHDALEHGVVVSADDVEITGLEVRGVANPPQDGAVRAWDVRRFAFRGGRISDSAGACISVARSPDATITDSTLVRCGQEGIHATQADRLLVRGNRIEDNNPGRAYDPEWEAGGAKVTRSSGVVFEHNEVAHNLGPGIWCDIDCRDLEVRDNRVWANDRAGIMVEISDGARVTGNAVWENGWGHPEWGWGAGILVSSSRNVAVEDNTVVWNADGIVVVSQDRGDAPSPIGGDTTAGNVVASEVGHEAFGLAWLQDWRGSLFSPSAGNGGSSDRFWFNGPEGGDVRFAWDGSQSRLEPFASTPGGAGASYLDDADLVALLGAAGIPEVPVSGHPAVGPGWRDLVVPALVLLAAGLAIIIVAFLAHRRRRRSPAREGQAQPAPEPHEPREMG